MANLWKNDRQFKIIEMTWKEYVAATDSWGLCDICGNNSAEEKIYFVALVNQAYCERCLTAYMKDAKRTKSDLQKEQSYFVNMKNKLVDLGVWDG